MVPVQLAPATHSTRFVSVAQRFVAALLFRRARTGTLAVSDAQSAATQFKADFRNRYQIVEITERLIDLAIMTLAEKRTLRGYDSVQLAAALELRDGSLRCDTGNQTERHFKVKPSDFCQPPRRKTGGARSGSNPAPAFPGRCGCGLSRNTSRVQCPSITRWESSWLVYGCSPKFCIRPTRCRRCWPTWCSKRTALTAAMGWPRFHRSPVQLVDDPQPVQRQPRIHHVYDLGLAGDDFRQPAGGDDLCFRPQLGLEAGHHPLDQPHVAEQ